DDGRLTYAFHFIQYAFDLLRIHVVAAGNDHVLAAADYAEIAALIETAEIAGLEVGIIREFFGGLLGHAPVATENIRTLDLDLADFTRRQRLAIGIHNTQRHAG